MKLCCALIMFFTSAYALAFSSTSSDVLSNTIAISSAPNGTSWHLSSTHLTKLDNHHTFSATHLIEHLPKPYFSLHVNQAGLWVGHSEGLSFIDLQSKQHQSWLRAPVETIIPASEETLYIQSQNRLYKLQNRAIQLLPIQVQGKNWALAQNGIIYVNEANALLFWDEAQGTQFLTSLPWPIKQITQYRGSTLLHAENNNVYLFASGNLNTHPMWQAERLDLFQHLLLRLNNTYIETFNLESGHIYQHQVNTQQITDLITTQKHIWYLQNDQWQPFIPVELSLLKNQANSQELEMYYEGYDAFQRFSALHPIYAVRYLESGKWAVASKDKIHLFTPEHGNFQNIIDTQDIKALYFTPPAGLWVKHTHHVSHYDLRTKQRIAKHPLADMQSITRLSDNTYLASNHTQLWHLNAGAVHDIELPFKETQIHDVYYNQNTGETLLSTEQGLYIIEFSKTNLTKYEKLNNFNAPYLGKAERDAVWQFSQDKIALIHSDGTSRILNPASKQQQVLNFRQKLLLISDAGLSVFSQQTPEQSNHLNLSHVRFHTKSSHLDLFAPNNTILLPSEAIRVSLWFNTCDTCTLEYQLPQQTQWQEIHDYQLSLSSEEVHGLKIRASSHALATSMTIKANYSNTMNMLWLILSICAIVTVSWIIRSRYTASKTKLSEHFSNTLMDHSKDAIWLADPEFKVMKVNHAYSRITGFNDEQIVGKKPQILTLNGRNKVLERHIGNESQANGFWSGEIWTLKASGEKLALDVTITKLTSPQDPQEHYYMAVMSDITERKVNEKALLQLSTRDPITGLANRALFIESLNQAIASCNNEFPSLLLVLIDIDNFRKINDLMGHESGDALLKEVANRLSEQLDKSYSLARISSDEFAVLVPPYLYSGMTIFFAKKLADDILRCINKPFRYNNVETTVSASCGIAVYPDDAHDSEHLIRCADSALDHAKHMGTNCYQFFDKQRHQLDPAILSQETAMLRAIEQNQFTLFYQPKYHAESKKLIGFEGLARWPQEHGEILNPAAFIPFAEQSGAIIPMTNQLLELACQQIQQWREQGLEATCVAVNISAKHFQNESLVETIRTYLQRYKIPPQCLELEITESAMMSDPDHAMTIMHRLKALGVSIALDDFGTGHSSLGYLKRFPIDILKIDRSFIIDIEHSDQDRNIAATIIRLAKYLDMKVVAEGVENEQQAYLLNVMGCTILQGYFFSKPLPMQAATKLLEDELSEQKAGL